MKTASSKIKVSIVVTVVIATLFSCEPNTQRLEGFAVHGIDISHHQVDINWDTLLRQNIQFAFLKATEGESYKDSLFIKNWNALEDAGILRGAYHFYRPSIAPEIQVQNFIESVELKPGELPPVLDIEIMGDLEPYQMLKNLKTWLSLTEDHFHVQPIIYTNQKFYNRYLKGQFPDYLLWIARYNTIEPELEDSEKWDFWQYGDRGKLPGIKGFVDFNVFRGSLDELHHLLIPHDSLTSTLSSY